MRVPQGFDRLVYVFGSLVLLRGAKICPPSRHVATIAHSLVEPVFLSLTIDQRALTPVELEVRASALKHEPRPWDKVR